MHFTIMAFQGSDDVIIETNNLLRSLHRFSQNLISCVVSNSKSILENIVGSSIKQYVKTSHILHFFRKYNIHGFSHHSGLGGYAKMIVPLIITSVDYTVVLDTDIVVNRNPLEFWNHLQLNKNALLQAKQLQKYECFGNDYRLNSGVLGINLTAMRNSDWFDVMWKDINTLPRNCEYMVQNKMK